MEIESKLGGEGGNVRCLFKRGRREKSGRGTRWDSLRGRWTGGEGEEGRGRDERGSLGRTTVDWFPPSYHHTPHCLLITTSHTSHLPTTMILSVPLSLSPSSHPPHVLNPLRRSCPNCANMLTISAASGNNKWCCATCPYEYPLETTVSLFLYPFLKQ